MNRNVFFVAILFCCLLTLPAFAQNEINFSFVTEGIQTATRNTDILMDDPSVSSSVYGESGARKAGFGDGIQPGFGLGAEIQISPSTKAITIPVGFTWRNFQVNMWAPLILNRTMKYTGYEASTSGVGDITFRLGYPFRYELFADKTSWFYPELKIKIPTGDAEANDSGYLVPLGTGSLDFTVGISGWLQLNEKSGFDLRTQYRMNGTDDRIAQTIIDSDIITTTYDVKNGNFWFLSGEYSRMVRTFLNDRLHLNGFAGISLMLHGDGTTDWFSTSELTSENASGSFSNYQSMTLVDLSLGAELTAANYTVRTLIVIPAITNRHELSRDDNRSIAFRIGGSFHF